MYIITYDIGDDKERAKVVKCVEQYCLRVQKSVWLGDLSGHALKKLCSNLKNLEIESGIVDIWEAGKPQRIGNGPPIPEIYSCHVA